MSDTPDTPEPGAAPPGPTATVLTVDDETAVLSALRRLLRGRGYTVLQAPGGAEGLALLREHKVDLVLSDMRMPGMDGVQFLEGVRAHDPAIARVLLTGYADISATIAAVNRGEIQRYLSKPWDDQELLLTLQEVLRRRELERQNHALQALTTQQNEELRQLNATLESRVASRTAEITQINGMLEAAYEDLDRQFTLSVKVFAGLLEMRENGIAGHSRRVAVMAQAVAQHMGLSPREQRDVHLGALLHDVGKIGFPDHMLGQPTSTYSVDDMARYRRHPQDGETALMALSEMQGVARIIRQHHERFDGSGFPDQLSGDTICKGARIVAAASDYDGLLHGMLAQRHYKADEARERLRSAGGSHYDPQVVSALLEVLAALDAAVPAERQIHARDLRAGMVLSRDLLSPRGAILLAAGYVFEAHIVERVQGFANREGANLMLTVRNDDAVAHLPAPAAAQPSPAEAAA